MQRLGISRPSLDNTFEMTEPQAQTPGTLPRWQ
jgi:hypothetical protein